MAYALELVTKINMELQSESPQVPHLLDKITNLYKTLLKNFIDNKIRNRIGDDLKINIHNPSNHLPLEKIYYGAKVELIVKNSTKISKMELENFRVRCLDFYLELCTQIRNRFDFNNPYYNYAANFTPLNATAGNVLSIANFAELFPNVEVDLEAVNAEWHQLSESEDIKSMKNKNLTEF